MHSKTVYRKRLMIIFITITTNPLDHGLKANYEIQNTKVLGIWNIFLPFVTRNCIIKNKLLDRLNITSRRKTTYVKRNILLGVAVQSEIRAFCGEPLKWNSRGSSVCKRERRDKLTLKSLWRNYSTPSASTANVVHTVSHHTLFH